jgi:hypothetical protein
MGSEFYTDKVVDFDEALKKLSEATTVVLMEPQHRPFLFGHKCVQSLDGLYHTCAGWAPVVPGQSFPTNVEVENFTGPKRIWFYKCQGVDRQAARRFMVSIGTVLGVEIVTEYGGEPLSDPYAGTVEYEFGPGPEDESEEDDSEEDESEEDEK